MLFDRRRRSRHLVASFAVLGALGALALTGCGGGSSSDDSSAGIEVSTSNGKATKDVETLTWALPGGEPPSIDPTLAGDYGSALIAANLCEPFMALRPDTTTYPNLGSVDRVSPTEYVFTLKQGIDFWDGKEATAEDLLFSFEWASRPVALGTLAYENVKSMEQTGPYEVTVKLSSPDVLYEKELGTDLVTPLIQKEFTEKAGDKYGTPEAGVMCTGPFELKKWEQAQQIVLARNEDYWNPERRARAKTVEVKFLNDTSALTQALASGEVEGAYGLPAAVIPKLSKISGGTLYYGESQDYQTIPVNTPDSELATDPKLFEALNVSIDREALAEVIFHGAAQPNYTFVGKNSWPPEAEGPWKAAYPQYEEARKYDPARAKKLVEESDYSGDPLVAIYGAGDATSSQIAQLLQQEAGQVGIKIKLKPMQPIQFQTAGYTASARVGTDLMISQSFNIIKNPLEILPVELTPGEIYNYTNYDNPKVTRLLNEARRTLDNLKRSELLVEAQEIFEREPGITTSVTPYTIAFVSDELAGATISGNWVWTASLAGIGAK